MVSHRARHSRWHLCDSSPLDFKQRCVERLKRLGDVAVETQRQDDAITHYSVALSLNPVVRKDILIKRSKVYVAKELWENAMDDTNQVSHFCLV